MTAKEARESGLYIWGDPNVEELLTLTNYELGVARYKIAELNYEIAELHKKLSQLTGRS